MNKAYVTVRSRRLLVVWLVRIFMCFCCGAVASVFAASGVASAKSRQEVRVGVLALRGFDQVKADWEATARYLTASIPGYEFKLLPLSFNQIETAVASSEVDFIIVNPAIHVALVQKYDVSPIATLTNRLDAYDASLYGGVIFRSKGRSGAPTLEWLKGKHFLAVDPNSLGGFLAVRRELYEANIDPARDFASLRFAGTHDEVVMRVLKGEADAGTVRTDVLERMAAQGKIDLTQLEIIAPYTNGEDPQRRAFPYLRSTRLYPEWPMSRIASVPDRLAKQVSVALLDIEPDSRPARDAGITGWNVPLSYQSVNALLQELELYPYERKPISLKMLLEQNPRQMLGALVLLLGGVLFAFVLLYLNKRLHKAKAALATMNVTLERRIKERTQELELRKLEMEQQATHDALTGLLNRRALEELMANEVNRVNRYFQKMAVLMLDIDLFKQVNDSYGHVVGDKVLQGVARLIQKSIRNTDTAARYGGEEFIVLLPLTNTDDALNLAKRLCEAVAHHDITVNGGQVVRVTVSIGVISAAQTGNVRWEALLEAVDRAMYAAKQAGRNCVELGSNV